MEFLWPSNGYRCVKCSFSKSASSPPLYRFQKALSCVLRRCVLFGEAFCALVGGCAASIGWKFFGIECFVFGAGSVWGGDGGFNCLLPHLLFCVV